MEWIKYSKTSHPTKREEYLCIVIIPSVCGEWNRKIMTLYYDLGGWNCRDMIVTHWAEIPELPKEIVL